MVNLTKIQEVIWNAAKKVDYTVVDYIEFNGIEPPFIQLGNLYFDDDSVKNNEGLICSQYVNIYSTYSGKKELLEMMDAISAAMKGINEIDSYKVYVKQKSTSLIIDKDRFGSIFQRTDRNSNKFYHAVLVFELHINC